MTIYVLPRWVPPIGRAVDVTSRTKSVFSPFTLGPVDLYDGRVAGNVENGWQYSKVYPEFAAEGEPTEAYWQWAEDGWSKQRADRYPMGRGAKPLYSWW